MSDSSLCTFGLLFFLRYPYFHGACKTNLSRNNNFLQLLDRIMLNPENLGKHKVFHTWRETSALNAKKLLSIINSFVMTLYYILL